eukprot:g5193.t1
MLSIHRKRIGAISTDVLLQFFRFESSDHNPSSKIVPSSKPKKRVVFNPDRFRQPETVPEETQNFPYVQPDPHEEHYRRRFYPADEKSKEGTELLAGWRKRGGEGNYGRSFRESRKTRDAFIARYGVEALNPIGKLRPLWETHDPGDLDDEKYFSEQEYIYEPLKPRLRKGKKNVILCTNTRTDVPRSMKALVKSLCRFSREGNHFLAAELIDEGADCSQFDKNSWSPLHYACDRGHFQMVNLFLMKAPDLDQQDPVCFFVRALLDQILFLVFQDGYSPLMVASRTGQFRVCQRLIQSRAHLELRDLDDRTAVILAALEGHHKVVTLLIDSGANINAADKDGWTALHWSCFIGKIETVNQLINVKANLSLKDKQGDTPLHIAAAGGFGDLCRALIKTRANHLIQNNVGWTPIHTAVYWAQCKCLKELILSNHDLEVKNAEQQTPEEMAKSLGYKHLLKELEKHKSDLEKHPLDEGTDELIPIEENAEALQVVTIKLGDRNFVTSKATLEVIYGSYFWMMLHPDIEPVYNKVNRPEFGPGPGPELKKINNMEYSIDRDPHLFSWILEFLRHLKYSNLKDLKFPDDKYELGMLIAEAKFYRLPQVLEILKSQRKSRQIKTFRNAIPDKHRQEV